MEPIMINTKHKIAKRIAIKELQAEWNWISKFY